MPKSIIAEGKTTNEAISNGLKQLNVSKENVDIKVLENSEKRSFFSILAPRVVKVELTLREESEKRHKILENKIVANQKDIDSATENVERFLSEFSKSFGGITYTVSYENDFLNVKIDGDNASKLIGYRGDVLNSLQTILNSIASKHLESKVRVILNIGNYKEKREKALEELADKVSKTVLKTGKSITLEPMVAYERKIIHNRLQQNSSIRTYSIGEEPYRKVVIAKNK